MYGCGDFLNDYEGIAGFEVFRPDLCLMYFPTLASETGALRALEIVPLQLYRFQLRYPSRRDVSWTGSMLETAGRAYGIRMAQVGASSLGLADFHSTNQ
ncbi:hypothetical protein [Alkalilimnicola ehrlichii]|uniref:hypothetical protein n=1 Tax=Alkalilimnicola ehrlichii TaxID=351052 RepID=UPI001C6EAF8F|nr:hypothetical protein [Alkalilimnicola ehrlichii]